MVMAFPQFSLGGEEESLLERLRRRKSQQPPIPTNVPQVFPTPTPRREPTGIGEAFTNLLERIFGGGGSPDESGVFTLPPPPTTATPTPTGIPVGTPLATPESITQQLLREQMLRQQLGISTLTTPDVFGQGPVELPLGSTTPPFNVPPTTTPPGAGAGPAAPGVELTDAEFQEALTAAMQGDTATVNRFLRWLIDPLTQVQSLSPRSRYVAAQLQSVLETTRETTTETTRQRELAERTAREKTAEETRQRELAESRTATQAQSQLSFLGTLLPFLLQMLMSPSAFGRSLVGPRGINLGAASQIPAFNFLFGGQPLPGLRLPGATPSTRQPALTTPDIFGGEPFHIESPGSEFLGMGDIFAQSGIPTLSHFGQLTPDEQQFIQGIFGAFGFTPGTLESLFGGVTPGGIQGGLSSFLPSPVRGLR